MKNERHAHEMSAHTYWRGFETSVYFDQPCEVVGVVTNLGEQRSNDKVRPRISIRTDDGRDVVILVTQNRLLAELVAKGPVVGDRIKIVYTGQADKHAPGMSPAKEFRVAVRRPGPSEASMPAEGIA